MECVDSASLEVQLINVHALQQTRRLEVIHDV